MCGGGGQTVIQPAPAPQAPSIADSAADYAAAMPTIYETQLEYMPQFADMAQSIAESTYPVTSGLQEELAGQAKEGIQEGVPDWMREAYTENVRSQLGPNASSGIGADYMSRGLIAQAEDYRTKNQQLALSLAGRQQLVQPPNYQTMYGGFTPGAGLNYNASTYGSYASAAAQTNIAGAQMANQYAPQSPWGSVAGTLAGGFGGSILGAYGAGLGGSPWN